MGATVYHKASTAYTASGTSGALTVGPLTTLAVDVNVSAVAGTSPTLDFYLERQGADGEWYQVWHPTQVTAAGVVTTSVGPGCTTGAVVLSTMRLRWVIAGTTPSFTWSASIVAR